MVKIIHLSDLHLGIHILKNSQREEQQHILSSITNTVKAEQPEALVIAGDIYDKSDPPAEAITLFNEFITALTEAAPEMQIMIISGNHDSGERLDLYRDILGRHSIHVAGTLPRSAEERLRRITIKDSHGPVNFYLMPYVRPSMVRRTLGVDENASLSYEEAVARLIGRENIDPDVRNVLVTHQFYVPRSRTPEEMEAERTDSETLRVGNVDAVSASVLEPFTYAALGHIHRPMNIGENARYCGTPLQYSLSEADQEKSITMIELGEAGTDPVVSTLPLEPMRRVKRIHGPLEEVIHNPNHTDFVHITLTDEGRLDPRDTFDTLRENFHFMLGWQQANAGDSAGPQLSPTAQAVRQQDPLEVCLSFLGEGVTEDERELLKEIIRGIA